MLDLAVLGILVGVQQGCCIKFIFCIRVFCLIKSYFLEKSFVELEDVLWILLFYRYVINIELLGNYLCNVCVEEKDICGYSFYGVFSLLGEVGYCQVGC